EPGGRPRWTEEIERVDRRGIVYVRLRDRHRSLLLQLSPPGTHAKVLARRPFGNVAYSDVVGLSEAAAAAIGRAYAARLERGLSSVPARYPHLAVAAAAGRPS